MEFLDSLRAVKIGIGEDELRQRFPKLGALQKPKDRDHPDLMFADFPNLTLAGLDWSGSAEFVSGKLVRVSLYASVSYPVYADKQRQSLPRHEVRKAELLIVAHFQRRIGNVAERFVPNLDCPAGNPYGLRHTWRTKGKALLIEFSKNASQSYVSIELADWYESQREQQELYRGEWPLQPASRAELREVAEPR